MKSPMNMAPNKMVSPAKALSDLKPNLGTGENEIDPNSKFGKKIAAAGPPMKEPMKMKSPMKMGSAYKLDKSGFKMKSGPVNLKTPGSVAKMAGVSPMKEKPGSTQEKTKNKKSTDEVVNPDTKVITDVATQRLIEAGAPKEVIEKAKAKFIARKTSEKK